MFMNSAKFTEKLEYPQIDFGNIISNILNCLTLLPLIHYVYVTSQVVYTEIL